MNNKEAFLDFLYKAVRREVLKKIVFSRPIESEFVKVSGRLSAHRGRVFLSMEYHYPSSTVSQKNLLPGDIESELSHLINEFRQANITTSLGDVEYKVSSSGKSVVLGLDKAERRLNSGADFASAVGRLDNTKNYILSGEEKFLSILGISDKNGRVHDKRQAKFRQINRFLEHVRDVYSALPPSGPLTVFDLCSGKSYLSFAVYYYLTSVMKREVRMLGVDLKADVIAYCENAARDMGFSGMRFIADDIRNLPRDTAPDMVISLHACDIATDIVIDTACELSARVILSTPCCHRYMNGKIVAPQFSFITEFPHLANKLCESATDALRLFRMRARGYKVSALELTDPDDTPKNTLLRAIKEANTKPAQLAEREREYRALLALLFGDGADGYLKEIR